MKRRRSTSRIVVAAPAAPHGPRAALRAWSLLIVAVLAAIAAPPAAAGDLQSFLRGCSALDASPRQTIRACSQALQSDALGATARAQVWYNRAIARTEQGDWRRAHDDLSAATDAAPRFAEAWRARGEAAMRLRDFSDAHQSYEAALRIATASGLDDWTALIGRGGALVALGAPERALIDLDRAAAARPSVYAARFNRGLALAALDRRREADREFTAALAAKPGDLATLLRRGRLRERAAPSAALRDYSAAIEASPEDPRAFYRRGRVLDAVGRRAEANRDFRRAWALGHRTEWLHTRMIELGP